MSDPIQATDPGAKPQAPAPDEAAIRAAVLAEVNAKLKAITGVENIDALAAATETAKQQALKDQGRWQEAAQAAEARANDLQQKFNNALIERAITGAASQAVDAGTVHQLLAHQAQVSAEGAVTIGGKSPSEAVAALLKEKPFLARAVGGSGSGSPGTGTGGTADQLTPKQLAELKTTDPKAYRVAMEKLAGGK